MIVRQAKRGCFLFAGTWSESPVSCHFRAIGTELVRRGHRVVLLVDKQNHDVEDPDGEPAVYTWPSRRPTRFRDAWFLRKLIRKYRPDCVAGMFGSTNLILVVGWWMGIRHRVGWYLTLAEAIDLDSRGASWKVRLQQYRKRLIYRLATQIVPNSEAGSVDAQQVYGVPPAKCHVLYLSLPDPAEQFPADVFQRDRHGAICVGRLHPTKGQDVLIRALAELTSRFPDVTCEFVGDGPCREDCIQLAAELGVQERCRFLGRLPHDDVLRRLGSAAVSVVPSRSECFGLVNLESLAMGTPVIASHVGGIGEIFRDGEEGFLVPADDPSSLADRIATLLQNPTLQRQMSGKARLRFQEFEQHSLVSHQADWFEELVSDTASGEAGQE